VNVPARQPRRKAKGIAPIGPGARFGQFRVGSLRHEGGMSRLYNVKAARLRIPLLLKAPKLGANHPLSALVSFENELNVLKRLHGPHVPRLLAAGDLNDRPYLVMEYIEGDTLAQAAQRAPIRPPELCDLGVRLCRAVQALHHQNVIHLDLNPANVRNRPDGTMVLIDFGLAHHAALPDLHDAAFGEEEGTTATIAPEQLQHVRTDSRSDVYAIGAILYQLATGRHPFGRPNLLSLKKRLVQPPIPPRWHNPDIPPWLQEIILRCLETLPERRFATAKEVAYLLSHPDAVHVGARGHRTRRANIGQRLRWWARSVFRKFGDETPQRPCERLAMSPHVLVALDLDHCSEPLKEALRRAVRRLAQGEPRSFFTCLSVVSKAEVERMREGRRAAPDIAKQAAMRNWAQPLHLAPERMVFQVLPGEPVHTILHYAHQHLLDLIVVGARDDSAMRRHLGSVSAAVAAQAPCSVSVVRTRRDHMPLTQGRKTRKTKYGV
jgi:nucleotide-binding universal stress UspA family protein